MKKGEREAGNESDFIVTAARKRLYAGSEQELKKEIMRGTFYKASFPTLFIGKLLKEQERWKTGFHLVIYVATLILIPDSWLPVGREVTKPITGI